MQEMSEQDQLLIVFDCQWEPLHLCQSLLFYLIISLAPICFILWTFLSATFNNYLSPNLHVVQVFSATKLNAGLGKVDLSPNEEWGMNPQLISKLKEQYKKERQKDGKRGPPNSQES